MKILIYESLALVIKGEIMDNSTNYASTNVFPMRKMKLDPDLMLWNIKIHSRGNVDLNIKKKF